MPFENATPRPWFVNDLRASKMRELGWDGPLTVDVIHILDRPPSEIARTGDSYNSIIAKIVFDNRSEELTEGNLADAELIVTAVNAHADLMNAAQAAVYALKSYEYGNSSPELAQGVVAALEAALKLARAET